MSSGTTPGSRNISPWWALLALPIAFGIGWAVANLPDSGTPAQPAAVQPEASAPTAAVQPPPRERDSEREAPAPRDLSGWTTMSNALVESQRTGKPIMIDFNAEWCGPCRRMKQEVFDDAAFGKQVQAAVIPVSLVDRTREEGANSQEIVVLQSRYDVDAFPTLVVFSPRSGQYRKTKGYGDPSQTVEWITSVASEIR